ncbi:MAG: hypothetical protein NT080_13345 [Spirochaetes bacterium]|nr:hypothetical protein [Spirochaetota bacterium]
MKGKCLNDLLVSYRSTGKGREMLTTSIIAELYRHPIRYGLLSEDEIGEIFARYPTRLDSIIDRYEERGATFEAYLASCFRFLGLTLRRIRSREYDRDAIIVEEARMQVPSSMPPEEDPFGASSGCTELAPAFRSALGLNEETVRSHLAILCLKHAWLLDESDICSAALTSGMDPEVLMTKALEARELTKDFQVRYEKRKAARESSWIRLRVLERRIRREQDDAKRMLLGERMERERRVFRGRTEALRRSRILVPNRTVAETLGMAKGTVDSAVVTIRKRIELNSVVDIPSRIQPRTSSLLGRRTRRQDSGAHRDDRGWGTTPSQGSIHRVK